jgi:hypothetical protein
MRKSMGVIGTDHDRYWLVNAMAEGIAARMQGSANTELGVGPTRIVDGTA